MYLAMRNALASMQAKAAKMILTVALAMAAIFLNGQSSADEIVNLRMTTGLKATSHSIAWIGTQAGIFRKYGLNVEFPKLAVGGPETAAGLMRGDWQFVQTGVVPITENVLNGGDAVIILRNTIPDKVGVFMVARTPFTRLEQLEGKRIGVPADVYSGQTAILGRLALEKAGVTNANYVVLGSYDRIYKALVAGEIDAGTLSIDYQYIGAEKYGWNTFDTPAFGAPSIFGTTRKLISKQRDVSERVVRAMIESIHMFKTQPEIAAPLLQRFLGFDDAEGVERLHRFYVKFMPEVPRPGLTDLTDIRRNFVRKYPAAQSLVESDIVDSSIIDGIEQSGFIRELYARDPKRSASRN